MYPGPWTQVSTLNQVTTQSMSTQVVSTPNTKYVTVHDKVTDMLDDSNPVAKSVLAEGVCVNPRNE